MHAKGSDHLIGTLMPWENQTEKDICFDRETIPRFVALYTFFTN